MYAIKFKWTVSKARDSYGYNICTLIVDGEKVSRCNGGGYDMKGTCFGNWVAYQFKDELLKFKKQFHGLTFHNPNYKVDDEIILKEQKGESFGLERYQDFYKQSSKLPTEKHTIAQIDGACGFSCVENILNELGYSLTCVYYKDGIYTVQKTKENRKVA